MDSTIYIYNGIKLISEIIYHPLSGHYDKYIYEYSGSRLQKKCKYYDEQLEYCINYEYENGLLHKEVSDVYYSYEYVYANSRLAETICSTPNGSIATRTSYIYDDSGRIKLGNVEVLGHVSIQSHVVRYQY